MDNHLNERVENYLKDYLAIQKKVRDLDLAKILLQQVAADRRVEQLIEVFSMPVSWYEREGFRGLEGLEEIETRAGASAETGVRAGLRKGIKTRLVPIPFNAEMRHINNEIVSKYSKGFELDLEEDNSASSVSRARELIRKDVQSIQGLFRLD